MKRSRRLSTNQYHNQHGIFAHDATHPLGLLLSLGLGDLLRLQELLESILRQRLAVGIEPNLGHLLRGRLGGGCFSGHVAGGLSVRKMRA